MLKHMLICNKTSPALSLATKKRPATTEHAQYSTWCQKEIYLLDTISPVAELSGKDSPVLFFAAKSPELNTNGASNQLYRVSQQHQPNATDLQHPNRPYCVYHTGFHPYSSYNHPGSDDCHNRLQPCLSALRAPIETDLQVDMRTVPVLPFDLCPPDGPEPDFRHTAPRQV